MIMTKNNNEKKNLLSKKSENKYTQSQKIIKKGGQNDANRTLQNQNREYQMIKNQMIQHIKNRQNIWGEILPDLSKLSICDLRTYNSFYPEVARLAVDIIVVKKKNGFNKSSNYIAIILSCDDSRECIPSEVFVSALGKEDFFKKIYEKWTSNKQATIANKRVNNENLKKKVEEAIIAAKIIKFFGKNYDRYYRPPFSKEFYDLNNYFRMRDIVKE